MAQQRPISPASCHVMCVRALVGYQHANVNLVYAELVDFGRNS